MRVLVQKVISICVALVLLFSSAPFFVWATAPSGESCPASLLGSGCHNMGNAWFNGDMTQYVNYGGSTAYSCSTNYLSGCSTGGTSPTPPSGETCPATLLGSGCHNMGNAWFNSEMNQYVYFGGSTVYSCSTNYITNCTSGDTGLPPPPSYGCSAEPTNLLGSGCHDMGTAWLNGEMNKYVLYNTNAVKECSKDYFSGCSSGGTTPPPPTSSCSIELINLLGSGCHDMGNAWFNGEMSKYVKYGELTVYECASNPLSSCTTGTVPPSGGFWVEGYQSYPRYGESGVSISPKVHIVFSKGVDTKTLDSGSVFLAFWYQRLWRIQYEL